MKTVYLLVGTPGSGKTWVANQLGEHFNVLKHDELAYGNGQTRASYVEKTIEAARRSHKPVIIETPSSIRQIYEPLVKAGVRVEPIFILEHELTVRSRYMQREGKPIPQQHITRLETYRQRAKEMKAFSGTSSQVLDYLKRKR